MSSEEPWVLHYWPILGRGEFVRIIFEELGVPYVDKPENCMEYFHGGKLRFGEIDQFPSFAPPMLQKGKFFVSSTPIVCKYLGTKFGLLPDSEEDKWHAEQFSNVIHDYFGEGCNSFHGIDLVGSYHDQKEGTKPYIEKFKTTRMPQFLKHFEAVLRANNGGKGFLFGDKITYVDLALLHALRATANQFPEAWKTASSDYAKLLAAFKDRMSSRPKLKAYFASDGCRKFDGDSMM